MNRDDRRESGPTGRMLFLTVFSIAMAYMESAVVVYLREIYYPGGFAFPLSPMAPAAIRTEMLREFATLIMLVSVTGVAARRFRVRLALFMYCFGVWDIFYYVWLKVLLGWPPSLMTWDILFLIPVVWAGPVLAPLIVSFTMLLLSWALFLPRREGPSVAKRMREWALLLSGALSVFLSFVWDYGSLVLSSGVLRDHTVMSPETLDAISRHVPSDFNWPLFCLGEALLLAAVISLVRRGRSVRGS
jgi:hypothetical protein